MASCPVCFSKKCMYEYYGQLVVENQAQVSKISNLLACKSTYSKEIYQSCTKRCRRAVKNRAFSEFEVSFHGLLSAKSSCKQFFLNNIELKGLLLLKAMSIFFYFVKVYLVSNLSNKRCFFLIPWLLLFGKENVQDLRLFNWNQWATMSNSINHLIGKYQRSNTLFKH